MKNKIRLRSFIKVLILFSFIPLLGFECGKEDLFPEPEFDLEIGVQINPEKATYQVGDTIKLKFQINGNSLIDTRTGAYILLGKTYIPFEIYLGVRYSRNNLLQLPNIFSAEVKNVPDSLITIEQNGQFSKIKFNMVCELIQENYEVEILCILQRNGIYKFDLKDHLQINFAGMVDCSEELRDSNFANLNYKFNVENTNIELMEESPLPQNVFISGDDTSVRTQEKEIYWIRVED